MDHHYLPVEILQLIYDCLDFTSRLRFRTVCRQWNSVSSSLVPPLKEPPWVLFPTVSPLLGLNVSSKSKLINLSCATQHKLFLPGIDWSRGTPINVCGSHGAFLTLSSSSEHVLYDPFSGLHLSLPRTDMNGLCGYNLCNTKLSCSPSPDAGGCMVAALMSSVEKHDTQLYFCRPGDIHWISVTSFVDGIAFEDFAFHKGRLYVIDVSGSAILSSYAVLDSKMFPPWATIRLLRRGLLSPLLTGDANFTGNNYLVESGGELLLVRRLDNRHISRDLHFQVFKLEEVGGRLKVVQLKELGERMLFVGRGCSMSTWSTQSQQHSEFFKDNCIYFFYQSGSNQYGVGRFDLEVNVCNAVFPSPIKYYTTGHTQLPVWITPPI